MVKHTAFSLENVSFEYFCTVSPTLQCKQEHCHPKYEIIFFISGGGTYFYEGGSSTIEKGALLFFRPMEYHAISPDLDVPLEYYSISFDKSSLEDRILPIFDELLELLDGCRYSFHSGADAIFSLMSRMESAQHIRDELRSVYLRILLSELIVLLLSFGSPEIDRGDSELGARVIRYLNENLDRDISLDTLARRFFVSKYYLCRAFKRHNGISVHAYINRKRLGFARELIENGESAASAAYKVGFGDYSAFYRAYVKEFGSSPKSSAGPARSSRRKGSI